MLASRFISHYRAASRRIRRQGRDWYREARSQARRLARETGRTLSTSAGVIAALSPRAHWKTNLQWSEASLKSGVATGGLRKMVAVAQRILDGVKPLCALKGPKVRAFYRAIMGDDSAVVVDVWIAYAAGIDAEGGLTDKEYRRVADALLEAASTLGVAPAYFQATVWIQVRGRHN